MEITTQQTQSQCTGGAGFGSCRDQRDPDLCANCEASLSPEDILIARGIGGRCGSYQGRTQAFDYGATYEETDSCWLREISSDSNARLATSPGSILPLAS